MDNFSIRPFFPPPLSYEFIFLLLSLMCGGGQYFLPFSYEFIYITAETTQPAKGKEN